MEIVSVQRKNYLCLLFRLIKVYTERISWRAIPWFGPPGPPVSYRLRRTEMSLIGLYFHRSTKIVTRPFVHHLENLGTTIYFLSQVMW